MTRKIKPLSAKADSASISATAPITVDVLANDTDAENDSLTLTAVGGSAYATVAINANKLIYTPTKAYNGNDVISYTISDGKDHTATGQLTVASSTALTLQGKVVTTLGATTKSATKASSLAAANVVAQIGEQRIEGVSAADGSFSLVLNGATFDGFISLTATGTGAQSKIKLASNIGDYSQALVNAGADHTLSNADSIAVNTSALSTAMFGLAQQLNAGTAVSDMTTLNRLQGEMNSAQLLNTTALVQIAVNAVVSGNSALALPSDVTDTMSLLTPARISSYTSQVKVADPDLLSTTVTAIQNDPALSTPITTADVASVYYMVTPSGLNNASLLRFNNNGTGSFVFSDDYFSHDGLQYPCFASGSITGGNLSFHWTIEGSTLKAVPDVATTLEECTNYNFDIGIDIIQHYQLNSIELRVLADSNNQTTFSVTNHFNVIAPNHEVADSVLTETPDLRTFVKTEGLLAMTESDMTGTWFLPVNGVHKSTNVDALLTSGETASIKTVDDGRSLPMVFAADHNVTFPTWPSYNGPTSGVWSIDTAGALHIALAAPLAGTELVYRKLSAVGGAGVYAQEFVNSADAGANAVSGGEGGKRNANAGWTEANVPGLYGYDWDTFGGLSRFWFELNADHTMKYVSTYDQDGDGVLNGIDWYIQEGTWQIKANGDLEIVRYRNRVSNDDYWRRCTPGSSADCVVYQPRTMTAFERTGERIYFNRDFQRNDAYRETVDFVSTLRTVSNLYFVKLAERPFPLPVAKTAGTASAKADQVIGRASHQHRLD